MKLTLGFSPCPNDTFIFDALVNKKIDTGGLEFEPVLGDVETLNQWALEGKLQVTKLSFPAFFRSLKEYALLNAGSALGRGVGPLLVAGSKFRHLADLPKNHISSPNELEVVLPGINTTANLLFSFAFPGAKKKSFMVFSGIEEAVISGRFDLGVIIHESRFTYQSKGLLKVMDLGTYWEEKMKVPIPLGGIAIRRNIEKSIAGRVDVLIKKSLEYAFENYPTVTDYVKRHSQEMDEAVMRQHIDLYVNNYSLDLGTDGRNAIQILYGVFQDMNIEERLMEAGLFVDQVTSRI